MYIRRLTDECIEGPMNLKYSYPVPSPPPHPMRTSSEINRRCLHMRCRHPLVPSCRSPPSATGLIMLGRCRSPAPLCQPRRSGRPRGAAPGYRCRFSPCRPATILRLTPRGHRRSPHRRPDPTQPSPAGLAATEVKFCEFCKLYFEFE
jgi:hypothetical protein